MKRKQQRLAEKPIHLLTFAPDKSEKGGVNPFAPSPLRATISKVFVKLEDMTERFEDWCQYGRSEERAVQPLGQRVSKWLGAPVARHAEQAAEAETGLVPARRWEGSVGDVIFRLRDPAGFGVDSTGPGRRVDGAAARFAGSGDLPAEGLDVHGQGHGAGAACRAGALPRAVTRDSIP